MPCFRRQCAHLCFRFFFFRVPVDSWLVIPLPRGRFPLLASPSLFLFCSFCFVGGYVVEYSECMAIIFSVVFFHFLFFLSSSQARNEGEKKSCIVTLFLFVHFCPCFFFGRFSSKCRVGLCTTLSAPPSFFVGVTMISSHAPVV